MRKSIKVILIIVVVIIGLAVIMVFTTTIGMQDIQNYEIPEINLIAIADGEYEGACTISRWPIKVKVKVKDHKIVNIDIIEDRIQVRSSDMDEIIIRNVIGKQSLAIDTVSGASITTKAYLIAITDALDNAKK